MKNILSNKKHRLLAAALLGTVCLSGCGNVSDEEKELASFSASISDFKDYIQDTDARINGLDVSKKESVGELLTILDDMDAEFAKLAEIAVPLQYKSVENLADEASENMSMAVSYYHSAYDTDVFDQDQADIAYQYYTFSMRRIEYIGYVISGELPPDDDHVTIYEETNDENILDKWLSGSKNDENETTPGTMPEAVE